MDKIWQGIKVNKMKEISSELWEVLVPTHNNAGAEFPLAHHQAWDDRVRDMTGGLTIMRMARGQWLGETGNLFTERMIPVRLASDEERIKAVRVMQ